MATEAKNVTALLPYQRLRAARIKMEQDRELSEVERYRTLLLKVIVESGCDWNSLLGVSADDMLEACLP